MLYINLEEAQELHENIGAALENLRQGSHDYVIPLLSRAREIAAIVVSDTIQNEAEEIIADRPTPDKLVEDVMKE
jgi:hypothetical protein